jgi:hypothetical protein
MYISAVALKQLLCYQCPEINAIIAKLSFYTRHNLLAYDQFNCMCAKLQFQHNFERCAQLRLHSNIHAEIDAR